MTVATWTAPPVWTVPKLWPGERTFVICGGESVRAQRHLIPKLQGRIIAVKHAVLLRPDADVAFFAGERCEEIAPPLLQAFKGQTVVVRGRGNPIFPESAKRIWRTFDHETWSTNPQEVAGFDAGTSAINLAMLFGATEIVTLGYDLIGARWFTTKEVQHYLPTPPETHHLRHLAPLPSLAQDAKAKGIAIWNTSEISRAPFPFKPLEAFL